MNTLGKSLIVAGIAAGIGGLYLISPGFAHGDNAGYAPKFGDHGRHGRGHGAMRFFEHFDANKDGAVTQAEIDQTRADRLKRFDTDGDGKLSLKEYEALWLDFMRERMVGRFQRLDRDGDATVTLQEFTDRTKNIVMWMDTDDDGKVTVQELKRMKRRSGDGGRHDRGMDR